MTHRTSLTARALLVTALVTGICSSTAATAIAAPAVPSPSCATLAEGAVGPAVATIQAVMHATPDGEFGPLTAAAVKSWQRHHDLARTGAIDAATWAAMPPASALTGCGQSVHGVGVSVGCARLRQGSTGPAVTVLQTALTVDVDGRFGGYTADAVAAAQAHAHLTVTGIVGRRTWNALGLSGTPACALWQRNQADAATPTVDPTADAADAKAQHDIAEQVAQFASALTARPGTTDDPVALAAVKFAKHQRGKPYQWGGVGPQSYDCSGLTSTAYAHAGVIVPRVANDQYGAGRAVPLDHARAGDLLFYAGDLTNPRTIYHVSMYLGHATIIDAPQTGSFIDTRPLTTANLLPVAVRPAHR